MSRLLPLSCLLWACALAQTARAAAPNPPSAAPAAGRGVVFVADGSGDLTEASESLQTIINEACLCLRVERVAWSHGRCRLVADLVVHGRHRCFGEQLAASVLAQYQADPTAPIFLVGHSAGAAVVLAATESLPAGCVERIILLAPAVSASYDLRPALRCSRQGVDSFYSKHDPILGTFVLALGTADRRWEASGGWVGFDEPAMSCGEENLSCKLRQYRWTSDLCKTGYYGGHYGCRGVGHLRERVLPLLTTATPCAQPAFVAVWPDEMPALVLVTPPDAKEKDRVRLARQKKE